MTKHELGYLIFIIVLLTAVILSSPPQPYIEICQEVGYSPNSNCPSYHVLLAPLVYIERHNGAIVALATVFIAGYTYVLANVSSRQAQLTREALETDKRAFVFANDIKAFWEPYGDTGLYNWRFRPIWKNTGDTPTTHLVLYGQCE